MKTVLVSLTMALMIWSGPVVRAGEPDLTPPPGDSVRVAVLEALRLEVKRNLGLDVVFVVGHLRVKDGWAWVHTRPQSPDGENRYEDVSALLELRDGGWEVVEIPCTEVDNSDCPDGRELFDRLRERHPAAPAEVFPRESETT